MRHLDVGRGRLDRLSLERRAARENDLIRQRIAEATVEQEMGMMLGQLRQEDMIVMAELMKAGQVTPVIDRHYRLSDVAAAIRYSEEGRARGKIIIDVQ